MRILFLGDIVGESGCKAVKEHLLTKIKEKEIDFVIANGENAANEGVGITEKITNNLFEYGVDVITTGNHVWDQKETVNHITREDKLLRPKNMIKNSPGKGFGIYNSKNGFKIGVLNLMGNIYMKKCDDVFLKFVSKFIFPVLFVLFLKNTSPFVNLFNLIFKLELSSFLIILDFSKIIFEFAF